MMELTGDRSTHMIALFDYNPRCKSELLLRQDDLLNLLSEDKDWSLVENAVTTTQGFVPTSFIAVASLPPFSLIGLELCLRQANQN